MAHGTCSVPSCPNVGRLTRGWCTKHYQRWSKYGTTTLPPKPSEPERYWAKVDKGAPLPKWAPFLGPCWLWTGNVSIYGYGRLCGDDGRWVFAHRLAVRYDGRTIPDSLTVDHLCRVRHCVRPSHLEVVTNAVNIARAAAVRTHCPQGHPYSPENTYMEGNHRHCLECKRAHTAAWNARRYAPKNAEDLGLTP